MPTNPLPAITGDANADNPITRALRGNQADSLDTDAQSTTNSSSDAASESSTIVYSHEAFETFQHRVRHLLEELRSSDQAASAVISRLRGGSFNRIIGITMAPDSSSAQELILRVPRFESADITLQVQILAWLSRSTELPVPRVVAHDDATDNPLAEPYILMEKLQGVSLFHVMDAMNDEERLSMAEQVARLIGRIHTAPVPSGIGPLVLGKQGHVCVGRYLDDEDGDQNFDDDAPAPTTFLAFLSTRFREQREYCQTRWPEDAQRISYCDRLLYAAQTLLSSASEREERNVLFHRDIAARNILVHRTDDDSDWAISGVLDWDDCAVAPAEVSFVCPGWLWAGRGEPPVSDSFDENDWDPDEPPYDEFSARIRDTFVDAVEGILPGYMDTIRTSRARCLRQLHELAQGVISSAEDERKADLVISAAGQLLDRVSSGGEGPDGH
ncbi:APH-domain-containing protein [Exidia glandulosa HHB12029]|uniref:APH-domain-containing protein n=1 Tax=Exidia glandulosa HHB12029 TaxID=1314781 RepID=A0A165E080_EXIGL|nr:APH-domain-containing protein [Exidia glandulosa HHB12029]